MADAMAGGPMIPVEKLTAWPPITDEAVVDWAIGTEADQLAAAERIEAHREAVRRAWYALPWRTRLARMACVRRWIHP